MAEWPTVQTVDPSLKTLTAKSGDTMDIDTFVPTLPKEMGNDTINQITALVPMYVSNVVTTVARIWKPRFGYHIFLKY